MVTVLSERFTLSHSFYLTVRDFGSVLLLFLTRSTGAIVLSQIAPMLPLFGGALAAFERVRNDIETQPTIDNTETSAEKPLSVEGAIELRNVEFTYSSRPDHPVLNGISLKCEAGK